MTESATLVAWSVGCLAVTLAVTLALELFVAALFRIGRRGLLAVLLINIVTNPLFNLVFWGASRGRGPELLIILLVLEAVVVLVEWRLLVWALGRTAGSSRRLFALSLAMNAVSAVGSVLLFYAAAIGVTYLFVALQLRT
jgi:hypothetical protein